MFGRLVLRLAMFAVVLSFAARLSAGELADFLCSVVQDTKLRNQWPEPYVHADRAAVRQLQLIFVQAACQGETRDLEGVLKAIELFFLDSEENGLFVKKRDRRAPADCGNAKYAHEIASARCRSRKDRLERQSTEIFAFGAGDGSRQQLIRRQSERELDLEIVFGKRGRKRRIAFGIAAQSEDMKGTADL